MASPLPLAEASKRLSPPPFSSYLPDPSPSSRRSATNSLRRERRISNPEPSSPAITIAFNSATMERGGSSDKGKEREKERRSNLPSTPTDSTGKKLKKRRSTRTPTEEKDRERRRERHVKRREEHRNSFLEVSDEDEPTLILTDLKPPGAEEQPSTPQSLQPHAPQMERPATAPTPTTPTALANNAKELQAEPPSPSEEAEGDLASFAVKLLLLSQPGRKNEPRPLIALLFLLEIMSFVRYLKSSRNGVDEREETGWEEWRKFIELVYLSSSPPAALPIFNLPKLPSSPLSSLGTLHTTCDALGVYLECTLSASSPRILPPPHKTLFDLLSVAPSTSFPCPDFDVLEHLSLSLGDGLHSSLFILADRMAHFFGHRWGIRTDANGRVCYAEEERRDKGIRNFFSEKKISILPSPPLGGGGGGMMEEGRVEAGKETEMERRVREANTTSLKKEDKLRWLLGPSYSGSASGSGSRSSDEVEEREGTKERRRSNPRVDRMENGVGSAKGSIEENLLRTAADAEKALKRRTSELSSESSVSRRHSTTSSTGRRGYVKKRTLSEFSLQQNVVSKQATKGQLGHHSHAHSSTPSVRSISQEQLWRHDTVSVAGEGSDDRGSIRSFHTYASVQPLLGGMRNGFDKMSAREEILMEEELEGLAVGSGGGNGRRSLDSRRKFTYPESGQSSNTAKFKNVGPYLIKDGPNHPFQSLSTNDLTDLNIVNLPPTSNLLSPEEKMVLVKRSRKLQALLGATLGEDEVEHGLMGIKPEQRGALTLPLRNRRSSFPPGSPPHTPNKRLSFMSGVTDLSATSTIDASRSSRISISTNFTSRLETINEPTKARADRRKKLVKLQRFLGEQVPISLLDPSSPQNLLASPSTGSPLARQASQPTPSREGDKDKKSTLFGKTFGIGKKGKGSLPPEDSLNDLASLAVGTGPWSGSQTVKVGKMERSATQGLSPHFDSLADIRRARKLEHMFGELPPEAFNSHRRLLSDTALSVPPRPASVASSVYRPSIITLNHIIDHEPEALATFINHYNDDDSDEAHGSQAHSTSRSRKDSPPRLSLSFEGSDDEWDGEIRRSMSSDGHRTNLKRAAKLANFFGTTKGEIFKQVLDDLEVAILEEDIPDEEREAVLDSLRKLRQKTVVN